MIIEDENYFEEVKKLIKKAEKSIKIAAFIIRKGKKERKNRVSELMSEVKRAAYRGVRVEIIINQINPMNKSKRVNSRIIRELKRSNITTKVETEQRVAHAKYIIIDEKIVIIGSHNWTNKSLNSNHEISIKTENKNNLIKINDIWKRRWRRLR
jgi:phosphatidylserine/phosphatidylglycerophosphate/cardiolipin synthase-like enzyme